MSEPSLTRNDLVWKMYEAQAIVVEKERELQEKDAEIVEKDQEMREKDDEIERMRQEIEKLQNATKSQQKTTKAEEKPASPRNKQIKRLAVKLNVNQPKGQDNLRNQQLDHGLSEINYFKGFSAQNATQSENIIEKQTGVQQNTSVLILGGDGYLDIIYLFDSKAQSWKKLKITLPMGMQDFGAVVLNEEIYIFGGYSDEYYQQSCYKLKNDGSWVKLASLNQERAFISSSSLVYKGDIWAIGGYSLKSVEKYDISQDKWTYMPEMNHARNATAAAVFKDRIFITGGFTLKSVEMFDPKLQRWILFCDLPFEVYNHTMLISNSTLSIFGGISESGRLNSVWEMDIEDPERKWTEKQSFKHPRCRFGIGKLSNEIIVFGGYKEEISEIFDGNKWIDGPKLPQDLARFAYTPISRSIEESFLKKCS